MTSSHRIRHLAFAIIGLLFLLSLQVVYWPLVKGQALQPVVFDPQSVPKQYTALSAEESEEPPTVESKHLALTVQQRTLRVLANIERGSIFDRNEHLLAYDEQVNGIFLRRYSEPSMGHVVGVVDGAGTGILSIERSFNDSLLGRDRFDRHMNQILNQPIQGSHVYLTIDTRLQETAYQVLLNRVVTGSIVVMDAETGAILTMFSGPTFDSNLLLNNRENSCIWPIECETALFQRATQGLYPPGSTWKTITLAAALENGYNPDTPFIFDPPRCDDSGCFYGYEVDGHFIEDRNHFEPQLTLERSYTLSANTTFAQLGDEMGDDTLIEYARRFGFSHEDGAPPIETEANAAQVANNPDDLYSKNRLRASTGIGQGELLASPLSMALVVSAVLNDGNIPKPHLVQSVRHPDGNVLASEASGYWLRNAIQPETAQQIRQMMINVVTSNEGTGQLAAVPGLVIGGKTGTAQVGDANTPPHAWFTGFAQINEEQAVVIVVLVEHGGEGGVVAAPIFAEMAQAAAQVLGTTGN